MNDPLRLGFEIVEKSKQALLLESIIPIPFEQEDPELGALVDRACQAWLRKDLTLKRRGSLSTIFHEVSQITRSQSIPAAAGRNDPCPCGSGHKYKKCCLKR